MLKDKLKFDFDQLDNAKTEEYYHRIVKLISSHQNPTKVLLSNLCLMLVYIYIRHTDTMGPPLQFVQNSVGEASKNYSFKILEHLPSVLNSSKVVIDDELKQDVLRMLEKEQTNVLVNLNTAGLQLWNSQ